MKIKLITLLAALASSIFCSAAEEHIAAHRDAVLVQGYAKEISATAHTGYRSHVDYARFALQIHSNPARDKMVWESAPVPQKLDKPYVEFAWIAGVSGDRKGIQPGTVRIDMNDKPVIRFDTGGEYAWEVTGENKVRLTMVAGRHDMHEDRSGYMILRVPSSMVEPGKPVKFTMVPEKYGTNSWVMLYTTPIRQSDTLEARMEPVVLKSAPDKRVLSIKYYHFGTPGKASINAFGHNFTSPVHFGVNKIDIQLDSAWVKGSCTASMKIGGRTLTGKVDGRPLKKWRADFIHITHTDIGYSRPQQEILAEHVRFLDSVLDYCDQTDSYPEAARFHWTCEGTWAVKEFLESRPQKQVERFLRRVKEGRIEVTGMYFNFDGLTDERSLAASLSPIADLHEYGIDSIRVAMQNDVNGVGWAVSEYLGDLGIRYLTMGVNNDSGIPPFDSKTYFWWVSPSGKKILTFYGAHYMEGNQFGIHEGDFGTFETSFLDYLEKQEQEGYPYDILGIEYLGSQTDNSSPTPAACEIVRKWNEKYEWPKLSLRPFRQHLASIEEKYGDGLMEIRGAWPDWWSYGFGSGQRETAASRKTHGEMISSLNLLSLASINGSRIPERVIEDGEEATEASLFYDEHTYGFSASINRPYCHGSMEQRSIKASYAWEAARRSTALAETAVGYISEAVTGQEVPVITVFNPLGWPYTGKTSTFIDYSVIPVNAPFELCDENGEKAFHYVTKKNRDGSFYDFHVSDVPAFGYKQYYIRLLSEEPEHEIYENPALETGKVSNEWYEITFNDDKGTISQIYDKQLQKYILDGDSDHELGEVVHETVNRRSFNEQIRKKREGEPVTDKYTRCSAKVLSPAWYDKCDLWQSWRYSMHTDAGIGDGANLTVEYRLYTHEKKIEILYEMDKKLDTSPEGLYVAFPFFLENGAPYCEVPGGVIKVGYEQIPGTSNDWYEMQTFASVRNDSEQIVVGSKEIPMMEFGAINTGRFTYGAKPQSNEIYSFVLNNYWTTNFNAFQVGGVKWSYYITSMDSASLHDATVFGWNNSVPVVSRAMFPASEGQSVRSRTSGSFLSVGPDNLLAVNIRPLEDEDAVIVQVREIMGKDTEISVELPGRRMTGMETVNAAGEPLHEGGVPAVEAYGSKFIKVYFE